MNDKSSPEELIKYRRYTLKRLWGGTMYWFATSRGKGKPHNRDARHMAEVYFERFEREAKRLLADLQSNGDIQITGPEESVLRRRRIIVAFRRFAGERAARPCLLQSSADIRPGGGTRR
jgi:hypothetical protein